MSDKNIFEKAKDMIGNVTKFQKQSKLKQVILSVMNLKILTMKKDIFATTAYIGWIRVEENV